MNTEIFNGLDFSKNLPHEPGVYRMYDLQEKLLYVGKAKDLKKRVSSYFQKTLEHPRIATMVSQVARMETTLTRTEAEALVLESRLIKEEKPKYNILLRDDRGYPYLHVTTNQAVPRLKIHRGKRGKDGRYFGPFPSREAVYLGYELIQKTFKLRSCEDSVFSNRSRPCLQYQIKRCSAPCVGKISSEDYQESIEQTIAFLEGKATQLIEQQAQKMDEAASTLNFEKAARIRDQIVSLKSIQARMDVEQGEATRDVVACKIENGLACISVIFFHKGNMMGSKSFFPQLPWDQDCASVLTQFLTQFYLDRPAPPEILLEIQPEDFEVVQEMLDSLNEKKVEIKFNVRGERLRQVELAKKNVAAALDSRLHSKQLQELRLADLTKLLGLEDKPQRIECFDISHMMGEATIASCVVFGPDGAQKSQYRKFNISGIEPGDDYAAMRQALVRRFNSDAPHPDVLLIDGGKGQVTQALDVLALLQLPIFVVGVAKGPERKAGEETLVLPHNQTELHPGPASPGLHLIQQVRDEAHRFAIENHRKKREKARTQSPLEGIEGVGPTRRRDLLRAFGGLQGLRSAGVEELTTVKGINRQLAERIYLALR